jgi:UDP-N-acetylmuramoyl-tripeptide--D-alanyl-D-alanine ligase
MDDLKKILTILEKNNFRVSTDTRKDISGSVYFGLAGENFDGNKFVKDALKKGAVSAITNDPKNRGKNVIVVKNTLKVLQLVAREYRRKFNIPVVAIGGSNGKTTSKELTRDVLKTKYKVHSTEGSLNNHLGVPLSILSIPRDTEICIIEIGANHPNEHTELLKILEPTHVVITNNGMDHLDGFGSPKGSRKANKEIYDWAKKNSVVAFVNKKHKDLVSDSKGIERIFYPEKNIKIEKNQYLTMLVGGKKYKTNLTGNYNIENVYLAVSIGKNFGVSENKALGAISKYKPNSRRSQFVRKNGTNFIVDCYNANPTSMMLSLKNFFETTKRPRAVFLGDMLEMGKFSKKEHKKIFDYVLKKKPDLAVFVGNEFKKVFNNKGGFFWFPDSGASKIWASIKNLKRYNVILKGSRGMKIEKIFNL